MDANAFVAAAARGDVAAMRSVDVDVNAAYSAHYRVCASAAAACCSVKTGVIPAAASRTVRYAGSSACCCGCCMLFCCFRARDVAPRWRWCAPGGCLRLRPADVCGTGMVYKQGYDDDDDIVPYVGLRRRCLFPSRLT